MVPIIIAVASSRNDFVSPFLLGLSCYDGYFRRLLNNALSGSSAQILIRQRHLWRRSF